MRLKTCSLSGICHRIHTRRDGRGPGVTSVALAFRLADLPPLHHLCTSLLYGVWNRRRIVPSSPNRDGCGIALSVVNLMYDVCICSISGHCGWRAEVGIRAGKRLAGLRELIGANGLTRTPRGVGGSLSNFSSTGTESQGRLSFLVACYDLPMVLRRF